MSNRPIVVAAVLSLIVTGVLAIRVLAIGEPAVLVILIPPFVGALLALRRPGHRGTVALACALTLVTAVISLIGGVGLLYVPSILLLAWGFVARPRTEAAFGAASGH